MKSFGEFLEERVVYSVDGLTFHNKDGSHFDQRFQQRVGNDFTNEDLKTILKRSSPELSSLSSGDSVLIYSSSYNRGIILTSNKQNHWNLVTILPKGAQFAKPNTKKILVESFEEMGKDVYEYLTSLITETDLDLELVNLGSVDLVYVNGSIWDFTAKILKIE